MLPGVRPHLDVEPGEAIAELGREDVPPGAGPLTQLDEGGPRCFGDPQQSIQPPSGPVGGQQGQRGEEEKGPKFEEQH